MPLSLDGTTGVSASGNITGAYLFGNASTLTGISSSKIFNGTTEANVGTSGGNANITVGGTSNVAVFATTGLFVTGVVSATGNITGGNINASGGSLSSLTSTSVTTENIYAISAVNGVTIAPGGNFNFTVTQSLVRIQNVPLTVVGNVTGGNLITGGLLTATGNVNTSAGVLATGNITGGNLITAALVSCSSITKTGIPGVGNIGQSGLAFNTVFAKATSAQYADLAENYTADKTYPVGTVLMIGGSAEVRDSNEYHSTKIIGTVSENPAYIMNSALEGEHVVTVALTGRVPCRVIGTIERGDLLASSEIQGVATALDGNSYQPGCVIGKALQAYDSDKPGVIEIAVGKI